MKIKDFEHMALPPPCTPRKLYNVVKAFPMIKFDFASVGTSNGGTKFSIRGELKVLKFQIHILYVSHDYRDDGWRRFSDAASPYIKVELPMDFLGVSSPRSMKVRAGLTGISPKFTMEHITRWIIKRHQTGMEKEILYKEEMVRKKDRGGVKDG